MSERAHVIRFGLLGGTLGRVPWEFFVTLGGSLCGAAALLPAFYPLWSTWPLLGFVMMLIFAVPGVSLVLVGVARRKAGPWPPRVPGPPAGLRR